MIPYWRSVEVRHVRWLAYIKWKARSEKFQITYELSLGQITGMVERFRASHRRKASSQSGIICAKSSNSFCKFAPGARISIFAVPYLRYLFFPKIMSTAVRVSASTSAMAVGCPEP